MNRAELHAGGKPRHRYCFGEYTLDPDDGFLRRGGEEVPLRPKSLEVLAYLVEHHGHLVTKATLIEAVWPDTAITDNSLSHCLLDVRRALRDEGQQLIRTVARRGYIFAAPVTTAVLNFPVVTDEESSPLLSQAVPRQERRWMVLGVCLLAAMATGWHMLRGRSNGKPETTYIQLTHFTDSAVAPVLSPDGRMLAFLRSEKSFLATDQIYLKMLPNGEPVELTKDPRPKCCIAFSPDGSRVAYTAIDEGVSPWKTYTVPVLGGEPRLLLSNATGLTWLDEQRVLFSEVRTGLHMGLVTATESRAGYRQIYFPQHERAMVHYSYASPDRRWALVVEMDPVWQPCRLVPLNGTSAGRQVGPDGACTAAAWSPDGRWMYFSAEVDGSPHLWRQRFPSGEPEQITFGPTEQEGVAMAPDGRSLITSAGMPEGVIWIHDDSGDRQISSEGFVQALRGRASSFPSARFSRDGRWLFYLKGRDSPAGRAELWRSDVESGKAEPLLPGVSMVEYDLSEDMQEVVFSTDSDAGRSELWLARLDRSAAPGRIAPAGAVSPQFGPEGEVLFQRTEGNAFHLVRINKDGSRMARVRPESIGNIWGRSADRRWVVGFVTLSGQNRACTTAISVADGSARPICTGTCPVAWAPDGSFLYVGITPRSLTNPGQTVAVPIPPGETFPELPPEGIRGIGDVQSLPGARLIKGWLISPGPDSSVFAYTKITTRRNLFRIPLADR